MFHGYTSRGRFITDAYKKHILQLSTDRNFSDIPYYPVGQVKLRDSSPAENSALQSNCISIPSFQMSLGAF